MPTAHEIAELAQAAFNGRKPEGLRAIWTDDFHFVGPDGESHGVEPMLARERILWDAFPDVRSSIEVVAASEDAAVFHTTMRGTHTGTFKLGDRVLPPTGRAVTLEFSVHLRLRDGLACGERIFYDRLGLLRQVGAFAPA